MIGRELPSGRLTFPRKRQIGQKRDILLYCVYAS